MNARSFEEQAALFPQPATRLTRETEIEAIRLAAIRARDEAVIAGMRQILHRIGQGIAAFAGAVRSWPDRRRIYEDLRSLSDRELADIGLSRGDVAKVFEPDFSLPQAPAGRRNGATAEAVAA
jgi:uncharacterized protein YjiS (DUF1127 family)